ncbi:MAG TPA: hypothetical protein VGS08_01275 [Candidatus Saccharimonadales bacterium]|nr:hypothetical protein [Candidatus Saccharimonadales bacterium]
MSKIIANSKPARKASSTSPQTGKPRMLKLPKPDTNLLTITKGL